MKQPDGDSLKAISSMASFVQPVTHAMALHAATAYINTFLLVFEVGPLQIDESRTIEVPDGWYFYFCSCRTELTPLQAETIRGAWPVFVDRANGSVRKRNHPRPFGDDPRK